MRVNQAILHTYDAKSCVKVFSEAPMDLSQDHIKRYVGSQARRALSNLDARRGAFVPESAFARDVASFFRGQVDFVPFTASVAEFLIAQMTQMEHTDSFDMLFLDFEGAKEKPVNDLTDEEVEVMYEAQAPRYLALVILESKQAYMHEVGKDELGHTRASIAQHYAIMPNPGQKVASFAVVSAAGDVRFCDEPREIAGHSVELLPEKLLQCTDEPSSKEVVTEVCGLVGAVAEEFGANAAEAVARAKAYVSETAEADEALAPELLAREVFETDTLRERFVAEAADEGLPDRVTVEPEVARRVAAKHRIRTDTGVDITFPAEYGKNPDFLEFESAPDGSISIKIKQVNEIQNR